MKRRILIALLLACAAVCLLAFAGCRNEKEPETTAYTIQYFDGKENCSIKVKEGDLYSIPVPVKRGYEFLGLFNAREGGVQYVDENGTCTMPFSGNANIVLFAQFEAKTYTVVFDYDKADNPPYTCTVAYGEVIPMPTTPSYVYGSEFTGWFTEKNGAGAQVSNANSVDYVKGVLSYDNFNLDNLPGRRLVLYAGFELNEYEVKFYSDDGKELISSITVKHGTPVKDLEEIKYKNNAVLSWARTVKGTPFTGEITGAVSLYALSYRVEIVLDSAGGSDVSIGLCTSGETINLPEPTRKYYRFAGWTLNGETVGNAFTVPNCSVTLVAQWKKTHFRVTYDSSGAGETAYETVEAGASIPLPPRSKEYYVFDGWEYGGEKLTAEFKMPESDVTVYARFEQEFKDYIYISDAQGFVNIKNDVNGKYMLINDLDLTSAESEPLRAFGGVFKGNDYTIELGGKFYGVSFSTADGADYGADGLCFGWFAGINRGIISGFTVKNLSCGSVSGYAYGTYFVKIGGICGSNEGTVENVKIRNGVSGTASSTGAQIICERNNSACGGICGVNTGTVTGCGVNALIFAEGNTGGIAGLSLSPVKNCSFSGKIGIYLGLNDGKPQLNSWGGIVGYGTAEAKITDCSVNSCSFEYFGEHGGYHNANHANCPMNFFTGIICGANISESNLSGNTYADCEKKLVMKGGNNHYGAFERSGQFKRLDGMLGGLA